MPCVTLVLYTSYLTSYNKLLSSKYLLNSEISIIKFRIYLGKLKSLNFKFLLYHENK